MICNVPHLCQFIPSQASLINYFLGDPWRMALALAYETIARQSVQLNMVLGFWQQVGVYSNDQHVPPLKLLSLSLGYMSVFTTICKQLKHRLFHCKVKWTFKVLKEQSRTEIAKISVRSRCALTSFTKAKGKTYNRKIYIAEE